MSMFRFWWPRLRSWWKNTSKTLDAVSIISLVILLALVMMIILGYIYNWTWAGLHGKTLYDWLQLLIIPAVLAVGGYFFNFATSRTEREIASDRQREDALQAYINNMSTLLVENDLREQVQLDRVRKIGRVRTLIVLPRLDGERKPSVLQFLYESGLIDKDRKIVDLDGADFSGANLMYANLSKADLSRANLSKANLSNTNLIEAELSSANMFRADLSNANLLGASLYRANLHLANLSDAILMGADLTGADLFGVDLRGANYTTEQLDQAASLFQATVPDGTKHP
jgi:uncharacterized protein YjbI with pentapeptide repeats